MSSFNFREITFNHVASHDGMKQYRLTRGLEGSRFDVMYWVDWEVRFDAVAALLGSTTFVDVPGQDYGYLSRELPHAHEEGSGRLFCTSAVAEPYITRDPPDASGMSLETVNASRAHITCVYGDNDYDFLEDTDILVVGDLAVPDESLLTRYVSRPPRKSKNRVEPARGGSWVWSEGPDVGRPVTERTFIRFTDTEHIYVWRQVPYANVPWENIELTLNSTNQEVFDGIAAETLIFKDYTPSEPYRLPDWQWGVNLTYTIERRANGANKAPNPDRGWRFFGIVAGDGSGNKPHFAMSWRHLFRPIPAP